MGTREPAPATKADLEAFDRDGFVGLGVLLGDSRDR
jgi:hypothetical protein